MTSFIHDFNATPGIIAVVICTLLAAAVLTRFTRIGGVFGFLINAPLLFAGAFGAVYLSRGLDLPLGYFLERTVLVSFIGILASCFLVLMLFSRSRQN